MFVSDMGSRVYNFCVNVPCFTRYVSSRRSFSPGLVHQLSPAVRCRPVHQLSTRLHVFWKIVLRSFPPDFSDAPSSRRSCRGAVPSSRSEAVEATSRGGSEVTGRQHGGGEDEDREVATCPRPPRLQHEEQGGRGHVCFGRSWEVKVRG